MTRANAHEANFEYDDEDPPGFKCGAAKLRTPAGEEERLDRGDVVRFPRDRQPGISSVNTVSPGPERAVSRPAMRSASSLAMASPRPLPWASSAV